MTTTDETSSRPAGVSVLGMALPAALIVVACAAAAAVAFGMHPSWAEREHGLDVIYMTRRLQWLLVGVSIAAALLLVGLAVTRVRRAAWLIGLAPVLMLMAHRFAAEHGATPGVADNPDFIEASKADFVKPEDRIVALRFNDRQYAYPVAILDATPAVVQTDHDRRLALFWNAQANRVVALNATNELRGRDLDIVSSPAGSLLVYNAKIGQFICGVTGQTPDRQTPTGLGTPIPTIKTTFGAWRQANPDGRVMKPTPKANAVMLLAKTKSAGSSDSSARSSSTAAAASQPKRVTVVGTTRPLGVQATSLSGKPVSVTVDGQPVVLLRGDRSASGFRAFSRKLDDLTLRFTYKTDPKRADVRMADSESGALWSVSGVAVAGTEHFRGRRLQPMPVDEDVDFAVMKRWAPEMELFVEPPPPPELKKASPPVTKQPVKRTSKKR